MTRMREVKAEALKRMKPKHRAAFMAWHDCQRSFTETRKKLMGEIDVSIATLERWARQYDWYGRAKLIDDEIERRATAAEVKRQAEMLKRHAQAGRGLQGSGAQYITEHGVDNGQQAVTAIVKGIEIERTAEGLPAWLIEFMGMSDDDAKAKYQQLIASQAGYSDAADTGDAGPDAAGGSLPPAGTGDGRGADAD